MIVKEIAQSFISYVKDSNVVLFIYFLWEGKKDIMLRL